MKWREVWFFLALGGLNLRVEGRVSGPTLVSGDDSGERGGASGVDCEVAKRRGIFFSKMRRGAVSAQAVPFPAFLSVGSLLFGPFERPLLGWVSFSVLEFSLESPQCVWASVIGR